LFELRKEARQLVEWLDLAYRLRNGLPLIDKERVEVMVRPWGETPLEIQMELRWIVHPSEWMYSIPEAAEKLHVTVEKVQSLIDEGTLHLSPTLRISESSIAKALNQEKKQKGKMRYHALAQSIAEINNHSSEMEFGFDGKEWLPTFGKNWGAILWGRASILFMEISKYPDRIKECSDCGAIFWDQSRNKSARYCEDRLCMNERNYRNVKKFRNAKMESSTKEEKSKKH
jgi:hypothetical protein